MSRDHLFQIFFLTGLPLTILGLLWLLVIAWRVSLRWGLLTTLLYPAMILPHTIRYWPRTKPPAIVVLFGLALVSIPAAYTRFMPVDLGPHEQMVNGERHLTLTGWDRTDYSILAARPDTVVLQMANGDVTNDTLRYLGNLQGLRELDLSDTKVTDAGVAKLVGISKLETLRLARTEITDRVFEETFDKLPSLRQLDLTGSKVTPERAQKWLDAKPDRMAVW